MIPLKLRLTVVEIYYSNIEQHRSVFQNDRPLIITLAPRSLKSLASAAPIPLPPPVIQHVLWSKMLIFWACLIFSLIPNYVHDHKKSTK